MDSLSSSVFEISVSANQQSNGGEATEARVGLIQLPGRKPISTPNFFAITSRGVIPHLTPDVISNHTNISGVHLALEDCEFHRVKFDGY
jgi:hypothetical protein